MGKFATIRETARMGLLSEHHLRLLEKQGLLPGVRSGTRFLVNVGQLEAWLEEASRPKGQGAGTEGV